MTKEVLVTVNGMQFEIDSRESIEVISRGQYFLKNGKHYVIYEEMDAEEPTKVTRSTIKISPMQVDMIKKGSNSVHMVFAKGQNNLAYYETPFGQMMMGINTKEIEVNESEEEIAVKLKYGLDVNYAHMSDCEVSIQVRPA
ncbi:MAG: DUF1934 domain-containing protein [Lachnospiraceae bacterium]|nr:DUF1934 domain-containing protein [Lachnospiraceae bacterium]